MSTKDRKSEDLAAESAESLRVESRQVGPDSRPTGIEGFFELLRRGHKRKTAAEACRVPYPPLENRISNGLKDLKAGEDTEDAVFYQDVVEAEAEFTIHWFEEVVLVKAQEKVSDPTKTMAILAIRDAGQYASPGTRKVFDAESGGEGPAAAILEGAADYESIPEDE